MKQFQEHNGFKAGQKFRVTADRARGERVGQTFTAEYFYQGAFGDWLVCAKEITRGFYMGDVTFDVVEQAAPAKPVFPFKAGDVVECLNAAHDVGSPLGPSHITEGVTYRVLYTQRDTDQRAEVAVWCDDGVMCWVQATRFCAPGEGRASLRKRIAELDLEVERQRTMRHQTERDLEGFRGLNMIMVGEFSQLKRDLERARGEKIEIELLNKYQAQMIESLEKQIDKLDGVLNALGIKEHAPGIYTFPIGFRSGK